MNKGNEMELKLKPTFSKPIIGGRIYSLNDNHSA